VYITTAIPTNTREMLKKVPWAAPTLDDLTDGLLAEKEVELRPDCDNGGTVVLLAPRDDG
jgi:hypothetical protein